MPWHNNFMLDQQAYWIDHNHVYFAFNLLYYVPQFIIPFVNEQILDKK
jgi:hypothetical protein